MSRILALDIGTKRIGVAVSDSRQQMASSLTMVERRDYQQAVHRLKKYCLEYQPVLVVVGLPYDSRDGSPTPKCREIIEEALSLREILGVPFIGVDERYSTKNNTDFLIQVADLSRQKRKQAIDSLAAREILQSYLDTKKGDDLATILALCPCTAH
ncbi:Holliday junction resolvase RuvX [Chrysiogenes arsenatis]|uniref:Holliday junction resolvase RuvX n=1 Tax=Chrysiogenes arsenatis TaxID=309797 RepID=UPI00042A1605|nr:Holliday junction resolvase RuvX [Chrysiogenes arsenatis]